MRSSDRNLKQIRAAWRAELPWAYNRFCVCTIFCGISLSFHALKRWSQLQDIKRTVCYRHETITWSSKCTNKSHITRSRRDSRNIHWFKQVVNLAELKLFELFEFPTEVGNHSEIQVCICEWAEVVNLLKSVFSSKN